MQVLDSFSSSSFLLVVMLLFLLAETRSLAEPCLACAAFARSTVFSTLVFSSLLTMSLSSTSLSEICPLPSPAGQGGAG